MEKKFLALATSLFLIHGTWAAVPNVATLVNASTINSATVQIWCQ